MKIAPLGINYSTRKLLIDPVDATELGKALVDPERQNAKAAIDLGQVSKTVVRGDRPKGLDPNDPRAVGWTVLVSANDPNYAKRLEAIRELAKHRNMESLDDPLFFDGSGPSGWKAWYEHNSFRPRGQFPEYILILGGPQEVPFLFQSFLGLYAFVGRLDMDSMDDLGAYAEKLLRFEKSDLTVNKEALFFAPDHGTLASGAYDPTVFSHRHLAKPLSQTVRKTYGYDVETLFAEDATKSNLGDLLTTRQPGLVFTASHGLGDPNKSLDWQKKMQGAIVCQDERGGADDTWLFRAADVPADKPFLDGSVFFQFACFGYGTPAQSDFAHWDPTIQAAVNAKQDFVAALPKTLLAHPRGPLAFIGHVDIALLQGIEDPNDDPTPTSPWHERVQPFLETVKNLLQDKMTVGRAMESMSKRYRGTNMFLAEQWQALEAKTQQPTAEFEKEMVEYFLMRNDAQNYLVFGDPAAYISLPG